MIFDEGYIELDEAARINELNDNKYWSDHMDESEYVELGEATLPMKKKKGHKYTDEEYEEMQEFIDSLDNSEE